MTLGSHQRCVGKSQVHLTPKWLIDALGPFDLDPCAATDRPWDCARHNYVEDADGLSLPWHGLVWLNPPFDRYLVGKWIQRLADHGNGIALVHARTEAEWFRPIWRQADGILFLDKRLKFCRPDGTEQPANSGAPPVLAAFGTLAESRIISSGLNGAWVSSRKILEVTPLFNSLQAAASLVVRQDGYRRTDINLGRWAITYRTSPEDVEQALKIAENGGRKLPEEVAATAPKTVQQEEPEE